MVKDIDIPAGGGFLDSQDKIDAVLNAINGK